MTGAELTTDDTKFDKQEALECAAGGSKPEESRSALRSYNQLYHSCFQAIMSGQEMQASSIEQSMNTHFEQLLVEMDKNKALQEQLAQMQKEMLQMQKQALERLAIIQTRLQALFTQTYVSDPSAVHYPS
ncbi:hypothetical protein BGZ65_001854 [Modicella reniformis]|uniref:Uncharacterized protein n=1 Tax=Modicella reniformis TaxID=1440133 RepID=A0A9P6LTC3_9FUNG|nr:hypothetical protein BGZ65_001854 [Modicella reniformis]